MLRLTFEGLADQIRIQHWQGRNFICRSGWILLNTTNKNDLDFLMLWCKGRELGYFRFLCKENLCVNVERALKTAELSKRMLYPHHKQYSSGQINQGKIIWPQRDWSSSFDQKSTCEGFLFLSLQHKVWTRSHRSPRDWSKIACFQHHPPRLSSPQSKWGPDRNQQRRFTPHESVIHQHRRATGSHAASEIAFYTCVKKRSQWL